jgi:hypothetical protein
MNASNDQYMNEREEVKDLSNKANDEYSTSNLCIDPKIIFGESIYDEELPNNLEVKEH